MKQSNNIYCSYIIEFTYSAFIYFTIKKKRMHTGIDIYKTAA